MAPVYYFYSDMFNSTNTVVHFDERWQFMFTDARKVLGTQFMWRSWLFHLPLCQIQQTFHSYIKLGLGLWCFNDMFNNISVISWRSFLLVEEIGLPGENHRPVASHLQALSHNVVSSTPPHERDSNSQL
jgi:hypothetical protein